MEPVFRHTGFHEILECLERVDLAIRRADSLDRMLTDVLDTALTIFGSDRAWLIYPCDPEAPSWKVRMERTRAEYPGALAKGAELPMTPEVRQVFLEALGAGGPLVYDPQSGRALPQVARQFSVQSQIQTAVYPKTGKPWVFGMHQCSHARVWSEKDVWLFIEIARRIADGLSSLLFLQDLKKSESRLRTLIQTIPDLIWLKDPDGAYLACNAMFERFFGAREADIIGKTDYDFVDRELADFFREHDRKAMAAGKPTSNEEWITFADDGHRALLDTIKTPMYDAEGALVGVLGIARDITERWKAGEDLRESEERFTKVEDQLRQSQKMESIGTLAGGVAHDFNNILSAIAGYSHLTLMTLAAESPLRTNLQAILESVDRAAHLTRDLLLFSRKQPIDRRPLDLNENIRKLGTFLARVIGEDIAFKTVLSEGPLGVLADSHQLDQIMMNLAANARDAMPEGGVFTISTEEVLLDKEYVSTHGLGKPGRHALITVSDTGRGMNEETRERIFEPFFTTKEVGKGTGLGMAVVYGIVSQHEGLITANSEPGRGAVFRIYLPVIAIDAAGKPESDAEQPSVGGAETILLAEDDKRVRDMTLTLLRDFGYTVIAAVDGEDAVKKFAENRDRIQLLLFDLIMPKQTGKDAYDAIRKTRPDIKVIFASGYDPDLVRQKALLEQHVPVLFKPLSPITLLKVIRSVLDGR